MRIIRGEWVLPVAAPPIHRGWVAIENDRIVDLGGPATVPDSARDSPPAGRIAIMPALANAHTHLEVSWTRGLIPPSPSMPAWVERLITCRRAQSGDPEAAIVSAIDEARRSGTALFGDVSNTLASCEPLARSGAAACVFHEVLGFNAPDPEAVVANARNALARLPPAPRLRCSIVPHAPYSVSPGLFRAIAATAEDRVMSIHVAESAEEIEFLQSGRGPWRALLEQVGAWNPAWTPPRTGPVEYLDGVGLVNARLLAVHGVQLTDRELARLAEVGATVVTCPRSNRWTGAGVPPVARFYASGVRVAVGTDSLASVEDLNLFEDLRLLRTIAPDVPARALIESATRCGAEALGFGSELGTIAPGKRAELLAVRIPEGVEDVEEYLVGGIQPAEIEWVQPGQ